MSEKKLDGKKETASALRAKARAHRAQADWFRRLKLIESAEYEDRQAALLEKAADKRKGGKNEHVQGRSRKKP